MYCICTCQHLYTDQGQNSPAAITGWGRGFLYQHLLRLNVILFKTFRRLRHIYPPAIVRERESPYLLFDHVFFPSFNSRSAQFPTLGSHATVTSGRVGPSRILRDHRRKDNSSLVERYPGLFGGRICPMARDKEGPLLLWVFSILLCLSIKCYISFSGICILWAEPKTGWGGGGGGDLRAIGPGPAEYCTSITKSRAPPICSFSPNLVQGSYSTIYRLEGDLEYSHCRIFYVWGKKRSKRCSSIYCSEITFDSSWLGEDSSTSADITYVHLCLRSLEYEIL
jgi:hypothetical protein